MSKSLYSLILSDEIVNRIDIAAKQQNTNRSNLINQILAEYVSVVTPEKRINDIFAFIDGLINRDIFATAIEPYERTMSLKSSLDYKYRPTIKYDVELFRREDKIIGELKVISRTQSPDLMYKLHNFFQIWTNLEQNYLSRIYDNDDIAYSFSNGKITRTFAIPYDRMYSIEETAQAINDYIKMFDDLINSFIGGKFLTVSDMERRYVQYLNNSLLI